VLIGQFTVAAGASFSGTLGVLSTVQNGETQIVTSSDPSPNTQFFFSAAPSPCPSDLDGTGDVGFGDILAIIAAWGPCNGCPEDLNGNGSVDFADVLVVIGAFGACPPPCP
jgi:hypothetical protein